LGHASLRGWYSLLTDGFWPIAVFADDALFANSMTAFCRIAVVRQGRFSENLRAATGQLETFAVLKKSRQLLTAFIFEMRLW
jgi:hypothetical protein